MFASLFTSVTRVCHSDKCKVNLFEQLIHHLVSQFHKLETYDLRTAFDERFVLCPLLV